MNKVNSIEVHFALGKQTYQVDIIKVGQEYCRADKKHEELSRWYHSLHFILSVSIKAFSQLSPIFYISTLLIYYLISSGTRYRNFDTKQVL